MKKKWWVLGTSLGLGAVLLWGAGLPVQADDSGVAVYQSAMKQMKAESSLTAHVKLDLIDNGKPLFTMSSVAKVDREKQEASVSGSWEDLVGDQTEDFQVFREDGKVIFKKAESDTFSVFEQKGWGKKRFEGVSGEPPVIVEQVRNIMLGNIREHTAVETMPDGSKQVSLQVAEQELPAFANKAATMFFTKMAEHAQDAASGKHLPASLPQLQQDIRVERLKLNATIDRNNRIERQSAEIHVAGSDAAGKEHQLTLKLDVTLSDLSQTQVEHVDLTGKKVEHVEGWHRPAWK
ncbi:hypothetical protein [Brevibacillus choshinensis]|uniref:Uncharacterized protein n=1 Tax=Brevibacillus choshinensis TaxID=54911 RepID=A0ABX7FM47_BRECH|nr:hypothetical protein [Brevibacillus choshinensis]QRG66759.1 hypothetical protein JNE38_25275 [Brevibacillus choshinensis]